MSLTPDDATVSPAFPEEVLPPRSEASAGPSTLRANLIAAGVVLVGFLLRLWAASGTFLNPDEAMHVQAAWQPTLSEAYRASLGLAHPPLLILILNLCRHLGTSELTLRLPSVIAGTVFCWVFFRWLRITLGRAPAWIGLVLACFLPPMIELSAEVRQYALLLCFLMLAVYWLEAGFRKSSALWTVLSAAALYLAMLSHFSGILFAGALGAYGLLRLISRRYPVSVIVAWLAGQAGALALLDFLYKTQISQLRGSEVERQVMGSMLASSYFHWGEGHWALFVFARSFGVFQFSFGQLAVGDLAALLFLAGVILLLRRRSPRGSKYSPRLMAIFLLLPFAINCAAALVDLYPYGGTRHSAFLVPFVLAGVSLGLARLVQGQMGSGLALALLLVTLCTVLGHPHRPYMRRADQRRSNMTGAVEFLEKNVEPSDRILADFQTNFPLRFYLCHESVELLDTKIRGFKTFSCDGKTVIAAGPRANDWDRDMFLRRWGRVVRDYGLTTGQAVWVVQMGWNLDLAQQLQALPELRTLQVVSFGHNIEMFKLTVGQPMPLGATGPVQSR